MGNIPLPALDVAPIAQGPDPIQKYKELVAIRAAQQQQQQQAALNPIELQRAQQESQLGQINVANQQRLQQAFSPQPSPAAPPASMPVPAPGSAAPTPDAGWRIPERAIQCRQ